MFIYCKVLKCNLDWQYLLDYLAQAARFALMDRQFLVLANLGNNFGEILQWELIIQWFVIDWCVPDKWYRIYVQGLSIEEGRGQSISENYQAYETGAISYQLTKGWLVSSYSEFADVIYIPQSKMSKSATT